MDIINFEALMIIQNRIKDLSTQTERILLDIVELVSENLNN